MAPKPTTTKTKRGKGPFKEGQSSSSVVEPHLRSVDDWRAMGKESLTLVSNSLNMKVKGLSANHMAVALFDKHSQNNDIDFVPVVQDLSDNEVEEVNGDGSFTENADADQSGNTTISPRKKRKRSKKSKSQNNLFSLDDIKKDLKEFLKKEIYNEVGIYKTNLPPFSAGLSSSSPLPPAPSFFPVAGSLKPNTNNGAEAVVSHEAAPVETPQRTGWGFPGESIAPPSVYLPPIQKRILEKIKAGEYINFDMLLPPALGSLSIPMMDDAGEYDINIKHVEGSPRISLTQVTQGKNKVKDYPSWCLAWSNYLRCMIQFFPHLTNQLVIYQSYIALFATQYAFTYVYAFDQVHRLNLTNDFSRRWDVIDDIVFNSYLKGAPGLVNVSQQGAVMGNYCYICKLKGHFAYNCPQKANQNSPPRNVRRGGGGPPCYRYNKGAHCNNSCSFSHVCDTCNKEHPSTRCPLRAAKGGH